MRYDVRLLYGCFGQILYLTIAHKNLSVKLRDAFTMGANEIDTYLGS